MQNGIRPAASLPVFDNDQMAAYLREGFWRDNDERPRSFNLSDTGDGAILLYDLGSGYLTAETAVEFLEDEQRARVVIVDAPFVLAAVSASIAANVGSDLRGVVDAALQARTANGPGGVRSVDELV